jgi:hypothetical protein
MALVHNGDGEIGGLDAGGLPDASIIQSDLAAGVAGNGPAFSAWQSTDQTGLSSNTYTKCNFQTEEYDTNSNFASSRFTPTVAGYYQVNWGSDILATGGGTGFMAALYKNGTLEKSGSGIWIGSATEVQVVGSALIYCNGSTDYIEIYGYFVVGQNTDARQVCTYFNGSLVRN